jgi:hypothetical protein
MKNIRVIKTGINVKKILEQIKQHPEDWGALKTMEGAKHLDPEVYIFENGVEVDTIQLIMGAIAKEGDFVGDSEMCIPTPAYSKHTEIIRFLKRHFKTVSRCGFLAIPVGATVGRHIDEGTYYLTRDRYHLSIQGRYEYFVGDEYLKQVIEANHAAYKIFEEENVSKLTENTLFLSQKLYEYFKDSKQ